MPALVFVLPAALTHSRLPEVHVLDGRYDLERFLVESDLSSKLAGAAPVVLGFVRRRGDDLCASRYGARCLAR
jgi:hypothetical protein